MLNTKGFSGVLTGIVESEKLVLLAPTLFINFFAIGYVLHGVVFEFKQLELSQILLCITISAIVFFGQMILLLIPTKVVVDHKMIPDLKKDREIIRMSFDDQDREIFKRVRVASNSIILFVTGMINYFLILLFLFMWFSQDGKPLQVINVLNTLAPVYGLFLFFNIVMMFYDITKNPARR